MFLSITLLNCVDSYFPSASEAGYDVALRLRNGASVAFGNNTEENGATGNGGEPVRTPEKGGDLGGSKDGTHSDGYEKEKAGMVRARQ